MSDVTPSLDEPLGYLLYRMATTLRPQIAAELAPLDLGLPEFVCLWTLSAKPKSTSAELARDTHVTAQAMNQLLHKLQHVGLVTRPVAAPAGRALPAELTPKGEALLTRAERAVHIADQRVLKRLTPTEQHQLRTLLRKAAP